MGTMPPMRLTEKDIFDTAYAKCYYEYTHKDSEVEQPRIGETVLLVGRTYCGFMDYNSWRSDSINDAYCREGKTAVELMAVQMAIGSQNYEYPLIKNNATRSATMRIEGLGTYEYHQDLPKMEWEITETDSIIEGTECTKARCSYGGRDWEAWFSLAQPIPFGPYVFDGLPGLVYLLRDTERLFVFRLNGLINLTNGEPIYLRKSSKVLKTRRDDAWKAYKNEKSNPLQAIKMNMPGVIVPEETAKGIKPLPYCPIELE